MRVVDEINIDKFAVEVTKLEPRSRDLMPLPAFLQLIGADQPSRTEPPPIPLEPVADPYLVERIAALERRASEPVALPPPAPVNPNPALLARLEVLEGHIRALEARAVPPPPEASPDLPAFMQREAAARGIPIGATPSVRVEDVLTAINEVEQWARGTLDQLARRIDEIAARLDMVPDPIAPAPQETVKVLTDWMQSIDQRAMHAEEMATELAREIERRAAKPEATLAVPVADVDPRAAALAQIKGAAEKRRNALIGPTADARDLRQRLTEVAFNSLPGREDAVALMERLADVQGLTWDRLNKMLISQHDTATRAAVDTLIEEIKSSLAVAQAPETDLERIVSDAIGRLERIGS